MNKIDSNTTNQKTIIDISGVNQSFFHGDDENHVLKDVDFKLADRTFNIIYGPSGSGKSTLLNVLSGLQKPMTGKVVFAGKELYELNPDELAHFRANEIGIVYQQDFWIKSLNVVENVAMPLLFSGQSRQRAVEIATQSLVMVGMADHAKRNPSLLSGGQQKLIAMARAIVNEPHCIIADEPTGSLDSVNGEKIMNLLQKMQSVLGRTVILVSHNMEYIPLADHLLHIEDGKIIEIKNATNITATANELLVDMKKRIERIAKKEHHVKS